MNGKGVLRISGRSIVVRALLFLYVEKGPAAINLSVGPGEQRVREERGESRQKGNRGDVLMIIDRTSGQRKSWYGEIPTYLYCGL